MQSLIVVARYWLLTEGGLSKWIDCYNHATIAGISFKKKTTGKLKNSWRLTYIVANKRHIVFHDTVISVYHYTFIYSEVQIDLLAKKITTTSKLMLVFFTLCHSFIEWDCLFKWRSLDCYWHYTHIPFDKGPPSSN